jgi:hypothetical protein
MNATCDVISSGLQNVRVEFDIFSRLYWFGEVRTGGGGGCVSYFEIEAGSIMETNVGLQWKK